VNDQAPDAVQPAPAPRTVIGDVVHRTTRLDPDDIQDAVP
jgi:hypothetical protein